MGPALSTLPQLPDQRRAAFSRGAAGNGGAGRLLLHTPPTAAAYPKHSVLSSFFPPRNTAPQRFLSSSQQLPASTGSPRRLSGPTAQCCPPGPAHPTPTRALTASSALLVPLDTAVLADPERVHTRWLLREGGSKEINSELESSRSKGGRRQRLSRAAMRGGRAALLRRTTMARGDTDPHPPGRARRPDPSAALPPAPLVPAAAAPGPRGGRTRGALRLAEPHTFAAENSERCAPRRGAGLARRLRLVPPLLRGPVHLRPPLRLYPRRARAEPGWPWFPRGRRSSCPRRAQLFLRRPHLRSDRPWRGPRPPMRRRCRPAPPAPTPAATGKRDGGGGGWVPPAAA